MTSVRYALRFLVAEAFVGAGWGIAVDIHSVRGWSRARLGFEARDAMVAYRTALRRALRDLEPVTGWAFGARYAAPDEGFVDVENAALYNIGTGAYGHLIANGLYCERIKSADDRHHLSYTLEPVPALH
jgi:hypothetical protein